MISVVSHPRELVMSGNTFQECSGTKGIIYLDILPRSSYGVAIASNTFYQNQGYYKASVFYIRARANGGYPFRSTLPINANLFCTGYTFQNNDF